MVAMRHAMLSGLQRTLMSCIRDEESQVRSAWSQSCQLMSERSVLKPTRYKHDLNKMKHDEQKEDTCLNDVIMLLCHVTLSLCAEIKQRHVDSLPVDAAHDQRRTDDVT